MIFLLFNEKTIAREKKLGADEIDNEDLEKFNLHRHVKLAATPIACSMRPQMIFLLITWLKTTVNFMNLL